MKAVVFTKYGPPDVLQLTDIPKPSPKSHEVLIRTRATTVTVADVRIRGFNVPRSFWLPARITLGITGPRKTILGTELAGEVESVGKDVTQYKKGDQVFAGTLKTMGGYAEYKCLPANKVALKPSNLTYQEAAALPIGARTALYYLQKADVQAGQKILVYGASGSVGTYTVQLAKHFGAEVTGVCSTANIPLVKSLGAETVIDYTKEDFSTHNEMYDVVFVAVDKIPFSVCMRMLRHGGKYVNITMPLPSLKKLWIAMKDGKKLVVGGNPSETTENLNKLKDLVEAGTLKPVIDKEYPLEKIVEAHRYVEKGHKKGNVVITL